MKKTATAIAAALAFSLAPTASAPAAPAKGIKTIYKDCADGKLSKKYKLKKLKKAKRKLPRDLAQYSGCKGALNKAIKKQTKKK